MRVLKFTLIVVAIVSFIAGQQCPAQQGGSSSARAADEAAIKAASQAFAKAFEAGDAKTVAAAFTAEAEYVDEDREAVRGRDALAKAYASFFENRKSVKVESKTDAVRFIGNDTAIEEGVFTVSTSSEASTASKFSALYVRQNGKWLIALLKEWADDSVTAPKLEDLTWLIGSWESSNDDMTARTTYEWTAGKSFIRAQFTITPKKEGAKPTTGTQIIGIDPAVGRIRSWLFHADGGIGEATWVKEGDRWLIESIGTQADGTATRAVNIMTPSKESFTWKSVERSTAGESEADIGPVTVKRVAQASSASK